MDLREKAAQLPLAPGVYLYKDASGQVIYVGKAKLLRHRVRSYFSEDKLADLKTGTLLAEARDIEYILVDNEKEALALENNLIKQYQPRFNVLLRDDKTYPYVKLTRERFPRIYVTRRVRKDGAAYFGPFFPANLAYRLAHFIHRHFLVPSCKVDLTRFHPKPCLQYHIHRCLGPCVEALTTDALYAAAVHDTKLLLEGRHGDLAHGLRARMEAASAEMRFEEAASLRDLLATVEEMDERQKMAAATGDDTDILACHAEPPLVALNVFHLRNGQIVDRREFFWENQEEFDEPEFFSSLLQQLYLDAQYIPSEIHVPVDFEGREALEEALSEKRNRKVEIRTPQRGQKKALLDLVRTNARHSFEGRFRVLKPSSLAIREALRDALNLPAAPSRIECFDQVTTALPSHPTRYMLRSDKQIQTFPNLFSFSGSSGYFNAVLPFEILLPDGTAYEIYYDSYGNIARVELPTGAPTNTITRSTSARPQAPCTPIMTHPPRPSIASGSTSARSAYMARAAAPLRSK